MQTKHSIQDYVSVVKQGIARNFPSERPKKVIIVGAGLAGLSADCELLEAGHDPLLLDAQHSVGGRINTMRQPFGCCDRYSSITLNNERPDKSCQVSYYRFPADAV